MYALFLETKAAEQIIEWANINDFPDTEGLLKKAYSRTKEQRPWQTDDVWVEMCLENDAHECLRLQSLFSWALTPEGHKFWSNINDGVII